MARTPKWKQLGLEKSGQGYIDKQGNYISERQYRKMVGTPAKGSPGYKERMIAKAERAASNRGRQAVDKLSNTERERRQFDKIYNFLKRVPGATERQAKTGKEPHLSPIDKSTRERVNKAIDAHRREVIESKRKYGLIDEKKANSLKASAELEASYREKMARIRERLSENPNMSAKQRAKLQREYEVYHKQWQKARQNLDKAGVLPPPSSDFNSGWYHV
jgi:hypothetical protein